MNRFPMLNSVRAMFDRDRSAIERIHAMRAGFARLSDAELRAAASNTEDLPGWIALAATAASRVLGQEMYDVQLRGALALARGSIAEMQTGEGKTLAAVPAIAWFAREHRGVHVMTVNDYLARRDAAWMGGIYRLLGLSVAYVQQGMSACRAARRLRRRHHLLDRRTRSASTTCATASPCGRTIRCTASFTPPSSTRPTPS